MNILIKKRYEENGIIYNYIYNDNVLIGNIDFRIYENNCNLVYFEIVKEYRNMGYGTIVIFEFIKNQQYDIFFGYCLYEIAFLFWKSLESKIKIEFSADVYNEELSCVDFCIVK